MSLQRRVRALEGGPSCPECGFGLEDDNKPTKIKFVEPDDDSPEDNTYCGACGRPIQITLTWGDER